MITKFKAKVDRITTTESKTEKTEKEEDTISLVVGDPSVKITLKGEKDFLKELTPKSEVEITIQATQKKLV